LSFPEGARVAVDQEAADGLWKVIVNNVDVAKLRHVPNEYDVR
jgi:hypothetical protein